MKPVEVIDLLSSPPHVAPKPKAVSKPTSKAKPSSAAPRKPSAPISYQGSLIRPGEENIDWFCLSDDSSSDVDLSQPVQASGLKPKPSIAPHPAPAKAAVDGQENCNIDLWYLDTPDRTKLSTSAATGINGGLVAQRDSVKRKAKGDNDFSFLSDDFDSMGNVDELYNMGLGPAKKKWRLTPEPESLTNTKVTVAKGKGISRTMSDIGTTSRNGATEMAKVAGLRRSKTTAMDDDPIMFTSSPDVVRVARYRREKSRQEREKEGDEDDVFGSYERSNMDSTVTHGKRKDTTLDDTSSDLDLPDLGTVVFDLRSSVNPILSRVDLQKALAAYKTQKAAGGKATEKARKAQEKLDAKEAEKERKCLAKEDKARQKQIAADLAKANTLRTDKKTSTPEMIVDLPANLEARLAGQVRQFFAPLDVECTEWRSPIPNVIKWRRKAQAKYNEEMGQWEPTPLHVKAEMHVMCIMAAREFVDLTTGEEGQDLDSHVLRMKAKFENCAIIYLIEGLTAWMRKNRNVRNKQFTDAVRSQMAQEGGAAAVSNQTSKKQKSQEYVDEDMVEDALLRLQAIHGALIHHTAATVETAEWVVTFTQHISTVPYRHQLMTLDTTFCMETGQVKTGDNPSDTFVKMLQEINRVTAPIAYGIAAEYPSAQKLVRGFAKEGRDMLSHIRKSANKDGALTDREVGKRVSRRLYGIWMGRDEGSLDV